MREELKKRIESALNDRVSDRRSVGGGCIADTGIVTLASGRQVFMKTVGGGTEGMFVKEAHGLQELAKAKAIRVPEVIHLESDFLLMEVIETGSRGAGFMEEFGRQFAQMHRYQGESFGFFEDNYIGATPQINHPRKEDWAEFYWENRLLYQIKLAESKGRSSAEMIKLADKLENRLGDLLVGSEEPPCVLHGDLWGGNYMVDADGHPVLIDPAVYYGHREADLGMTHLFGGFNDRFYRAYNEAYPLPAGHGDRVGLYMLYHILNHLNLFGSGYYSQAISIMRQYS